MTEAQAGGLGCRICGNEAANALHHAREMFYGTRHPFAYVECAACGTIQIQQVPDLRPYYAQNYYSFAHAQADAQPAALGIKRNLAARVGAFVRRTAGAYYGQRRARLGQLRHPLGRSLSALLPRLVAGFPEYLLDTRVNLNLTPRSAILDFGSGAGSTLLTLSLFGFRDLTGVDPFVEADIEYGDGVRVLKTELSGLSRQFDLILANHSVEHVADPRATLVEIRRVLKPGRFAVIRIPVVAHAWERYGVNWVQLDPPRHLFLFNVHTFAGLATEAGFALEELRHDSTAFQFWGSEQYARDIPLTDERSYLLNPAASIFEAGQLAAFAAQAEELNRRGEGDQAVFYLRKPVTGD
ncbi:MAG TPA: class I SAM-dependent methyltransferase [Pyrinomonadaceae bacterium]